MTRRPVVVPALGETVVEATISRWHKKPGDPVKGGEAIVSVTTDKVDVDLCADTSGVLAETLRAEGEAAPIGAVLAWIEADEGSVGGAEPVDRAARVEAEGTSRKPFVVPFLGESNIEVEIVRWKKKPGELVHAGEVVLEVQTDKLCIDMEAPSDGILGEIVATHGDVVPVGGLLAFIDPAKAVPTTPAISTAPSPERLPPSPAEKRAEPTGTQRAGTDAPKGRVVVVGGGTTGFTAAMRLSQLGWSVDVVERAEQLGGRHAHGGALARRTVLAEAARRPVPSMAALRERVVEVERVFRTGYGLLCKARGVTVHRGEGRVLEDSSVAVLDGAGDVQTTLAADHVVVATGGAPLDPPGVEIDGTRVVRDRDALASDEPPQRVHVIGASVAGLEWAAAFTALGVEVTLFDAQPRLLPALDLDVSREVERSFLRRGTHLQLGASYVTTERNADQMVWTRFVLGGVAHTWTATRVLVATGSAAGTLSAEPARENVWTIGGAARDLGQRSSSRMDAVAIAERIAGVPSSVPAASSPHVVHLGAFDVAWVGATEADVVRDGIPHRVGKAPFAANPSARALGVREGLAKLVVHAGSDRVLGAQIVGPAAAERIDEVTLAITLGATADDLARVPRTPGSLAETLGEAARSAAGWPLLLMR